MTEASRAAQPLAGQVCAMIAVDIAGYTRPDRDDEFRLHMRNALYVLLRDACRGSGLPWDECQHADCGDGALVIIPPGITALPLIDPFPERLRSLIRRHNRMSAEPARMQLRVAANIGPVHRDDHGIAGDDVTLLFRMLDAQPVRRALSESEAECVLVVSDYMYECLVRCHPSLIDPGSFRPLRTRVKGNQVHGWFCLPGEPPA